MADAPKLLGTDTLRQAYPKFNQAIDNANEALGTANTAKSTADTAKSTADTALANSESTQNQLNAVVVDGDSSPQIAQALADTPYTTLKEKHDAVDAQLAETEKKFKQLENLKGIGNFYRKLKAGKKVKVAIMGDSTAEGAGGTPYWWELLLSETYRTDPRSLLDYFDVPSNYLTVDNYAIGGSTADLMLMHVVSTMNLKGNGEYFALAHSNRTYKTSKVLDKNYDLVIIDTGANYSTHNNVMVEELIRRWIQAGTEVLLVSAHRDTSNNVPYYKADYQKLSQHYGCTLLDIDDLYIEDWAYASTHYYTDTIHQSVEGHQFWASSFLDVFKLIDDIKIVSSSSAIIPSKRLFWFTDNNADKQKNFACFMVNLPQYHNGTLTTISTGYGMDNPALNHDFTNCVLLAAGQYVSYGFDNAIFAVPLYGGRNLATTLWYTLNRQPGVQYVASLGNPGYKGQVTKQQITYDQFNYTTFNGKNAIDNNIGQRILKVLCNAGEILVLGCLVFTEVFEEIPVTNPMKSNVSLLPTLADWNKQTLPSGIDWYTNISQNGEITVDFVGGGIGINIGSSAMAGIIDVYIDNVKIASIDGYIAGQTSSQGFVYYSFYANSYGKHKARFVLNGANASASTPTANMPRLSFSKITVLDGKEDVTEYNEIKKYWSKLGY